MGYKSNIGQIEIKSSNGEVFAEGFASTTDPDLVDDIVSEMGQVRIDEQMEDRVIKLDWEHESYHDPKTSIVHDNPKHLNPIGKVIEHELKETPDGSLGTWIKVKLNKAHSKYNELVESIKGGYTDAFSIFYNVTKSKNINFGGKILRQIDDLMIINITFTSIPANPKAYANIALKSLNKKMVEENKEIESLKAEIKSLTDKNAELTTSSETLTNEVAELKSSVEVKSAEVKSVNKKEEEFQAEIKSKFEKVDKIDNIETEMAEIKSYIEKLKTTAIAGSEMKAQHQAEVKSVGNQSISFGSLMPTGENN